MEFEAQLRAASPWLLRVAVVIAVATAWRFSSHAHPRWVLLATAWVLACIGYVAPAAFSLWAAGLTSLGTAGGWAWRRRFLRARTRGREEAGLPHAASLPSLSVALPVTGDRFFEAPHELMFDDPRLWLAPVHFAWAPIWLPLDLFLGVEPVWEPGQTDGTSGATHAGATSAVTAGRWLVELRLDAGRECPLRFVIAETADRVTANRICNQVTEWAADVTKGVRRPAARYPRIRDADALLRLILQSLDSFEAEVRSEPSALEALWDEANSPQRRPKREYALSNALDRHLRRELEPLGVGAFREVELRPGLVRGSGQRVDLFVCAAVPDQRSGAYQLAVVAIEVKLDDHEKVNTAMADQLVGRYLRSTRRAQHGVYVVGFYPGGPYRPARAPLLQPLAAALSAQATCLSTAETQVRARVLNLALP